MSRTISLNYIFHCLKYTECLQNVNMKLYRWVSFWFLTKHKKPLTQESEFFAFSNVWVYIIIFKMSFRRVKFPPKLKHTSTQDHEIVHGCYVAFYLEKQWHGPAGAEWCVPVLSAPLWDAAMCRFCDSQSNYNQGYFSAASKSSSKPAHQQMGLLASWAEEPQTPAVTICFVPTKCNISDHAQLTKNLQQVISVD